MKLTFITIEPHRETGRQTSSQRKLHFNGAM